MDDVRWRVIPATRALCFVNVVVGLLLLGSSLIALSTQQLHAPALEVVVASVAGLMIICALIGLAMPRLRR